MAFVYPEKDIDRPEKTSELLGSFWNRVFAAEEQIAAYAAARNRLERQKAQDLQEALDLLGRQSAPVLHREHWYLLRLKESERDTGDVGLLAYGDSYASKAVVYGEQSDGYQYRYGVVRDGDYTVFPLPSALREAPFILNRVTDTETVWTAGLDYYLDLARGRIVFRQDPFAAGNFPLREVFAGDEVVDREVDLWIYQAGLDESYLYRHFGYILGIPGPSTENYREFLNAIFDAIVQGSASGQLARALAAMTDTPLVRNESETVEAIAQDERHLLVITDREVYRFPKEATPVVSVGQTVQQDDPLVDTLEFLEFNRGEMPSDLAAIEIPRDMLVGDYYGGISFPNDEKDLIVSTDGVFTRVEFELGGFPGDVAEFWDQFHARGVANPPTLAQLLDRRENPPDEPGAASLPETINPLQFLIENVLRHHAFAVRLKPRQFGSQALGLGYARFLRDIIPPHTWMLILLELVAPTDEIMMEGAGTETEAGYSENPVLGRGATASTESISPSASITEQPRLSHTRGRCL